MLTSWERSVELAYFNHRVIAEINKTQQVNWLLIDFGLDNIGKEEINEALDRMLLAFNRLFKYKSVQQVHLGYFRMLDILKQGDVYHPRIHILVPMMKSYFQGRYYIKRSEWSSLWSRSLGTTESLYVKVKTIKEKEQCEFYSEKLLNFREQENESSSVKSKIITPRRFIGYSKLLKNVADQLKGGKSLYLDMDKFCINDAVANQALINMLTWHPGLREEVGNSLIK
ncbi:MULTISPECIES: protein rep [unclassified Bacillus cereus group]|uniref:protein rep n=1 Tax=unclassified Bacillus cereus group TaxID=2750818 RepID=UPI001F597B8F|nr:MULTISPECIES: protein rep [unclassified Bacillus cereus group]